MSKESVFIKDDKKETKKKKIMILSCHTPSLLWFRLDMMKYFVDSGYEVVAVGNESENIWSDEFKKHYIKYRKVSIQRNGTNPLADLKMYKNLRKIMKEERPSIVFSYNAKAVIYGSLAASKLGIKCFSLIAGIGSIFLSSSLKIKVIRSILLCQYKATLPRCSKVFFQNSEDASMFVEKKIVSPNKIVFINGSGVNTELFPLLPQPGEFGFIFVGRLLKDKGIVEFLAASAELKKNYPNVNIFVVGPFDTNPSSINKQFLNKYINDGTIIYYGEQKDVLPYLLKANVLVLPSYREGTPKTVLEAMSCGRAIITTDVPGCRQTIIDGVHGFIIPDHDSKAILDKMIYLLEHKEECASMGIKARGRVEDIYDVRKVNKVILDTIKEN